MRVTNKMLSDNFLRDMSTNLENMQTLQQQMTSGKEIRKPSDDPFKVARAMQLHSSININQQYNDNIKDTSNWLDTTDTALGQAGNVMQRVRELLISAGNAAYGTSERKAIKDEINQKIGELSQVLNTNFDGSYVFGGTRGTTKPTGTTTDSNGNTQIGYYKAEGQLLDPTADASQIALIGNKRAVEISQGVTVQYSVSASDVLNFKDTTGTVNQNLSELFQAITNHLDNKLNSSANSQYNDNAATDKPDAALIGKDLQGVTDAINNLLKVRSEVGAKQNSMDDAKSKNEDENYNLTQILSKTEDIDITQKTMEYATMQTVYTASLQTSARVIQPTLLDYLR